ncbi:3'-5' exonuclease [Mucilaginibacter arboris]|uniref:3'-5' exonuclease n=1 Tax=Mucilaginibacter arboris TaxID=2682090 RepID=A0A7K1SUR0_9SPHI|nr:3'-5' exonuclease [Mucilaginibacter arboris]MVN21061.1 3'-5' exonuclease [Mucilaginibacter arboris]
MIDNLLFIDTEASGLPKKWNAPYSKVNNWPFSVQISWLIYNRNGNLIKQEDHYIKDNDFKISPAAQDIHGITREFLNEHGELRHEVMELLAKDMELYRPLMIGHFMELDFHVLSADFFRSGVENPISNMKMFCTMIATKRLADNTQHKYLRLGDLYQLLFKTPLLHQHNALTDAAATAECYFELIKRGEIDEEYILKQQSLKSYEHPFNRFIGWAVVILILLLLLIILLTYRGTT